MAFEDEMLHHAEQIKLRLPNVKGEEGAKDALVVPLLAVLGYDVSNPLQVQPQFIADFARRRSNGQMEKVDYALLIDRTPVVFVECKAPGERLEPHEGQLARYFNAFPSVRIALLTNGVRLQAFSDLIRPNYMDDKPWFDVDLREVKPAELKALGTLRKAGFVAHDVLNLAEDMADYHAIVTFAGEQLVEPGEAFVKFVATQIKKENETEAEAEVPHSGKKVGSKAVGRLKPIVKEAFKAAIMEKFSHSLDAPAKPAPEPLPVGEAKAGVVITAEEKECCSIISSIIRDVAPDAVVSYKDSEGHLTVVQDHHAHRWFARLEVRHAPYRVSFRHVKVDEARQLCPGLEVEEVGSLCRFTIKAISDLTKLRPVVVAEYKAEAAKHSTT